MAGSKKDTFETSILQHIFQNADVAAIGDATGLRGSSTAGSVYIALFTAAPSDSAQGTETTYTNYARVAVARSAGGWTVSGNNCSNAAAITFPACGASGATLVAFAVCKAGTAGVNDQLYWGDLTANLVVSSGITPEFAIGDLDINED
jgi:phage baseplate assembly protein gpV